MKSSPFIAPLVHNPWANKWGLQTVWPQFNSSSGRFGCQKCWLRSVLSSLWY